MDETWRPYWAMASVGLWSGFFSWMTIYLPPAGLAWMPGTVYGFFVMRPLTWRLAYRKARIAAAAGVSTIAYFVAYLIQDSRRGSDNSALYVVMMGVAGFTGAVIVGTGLLTILGQRHSVGILVRIAMAGGIAGSLFGVLLVALPGDDLFYLSKTLLGYLIWQSTTAFQLGRTFATVSSQVKSRSDFMTFFL